MPDDVRKVLGWRERVDLPGLGIHRLRAKIDTGARSSCLHVDAQWRFIEAGAPWIGFRLHDRRKADRVMEATAEIIDERHVTDSGAHRTLRPFIRTRLLLAGIDRDIVLNLADRGAMQFPMLLGRSAMQEAFMVDPLSLIHISEPTRRS